MAAENEFSAPEISYLRILEKCLFNTDKHFVVLLMFEGHSSKSEKSKIWPSFILSARGVYYKKYPDKRFTLCVRACQFA